MVKQEQDHSNHQQPGTLSLSSIFRLENSASELMPSMNADCVDLPAFIITPEISQSLRRARLYSIITEALRISEELEQFYTENGHDYHPDHDRSTSRTTMKPHFIRDTSPQ